MGRVFITFFLAVCVSFALFPTNSFAASRLLYENFDDQELDSKLRVREDLSGYPSGDLEPPQYNLNAVGRTGVGYCFSSGTVNSANLLWIDDMVDPWPSDEMYVSFWMRYPTFKSTDSHENIKFFYPHWSGTDSYVHYCMSSEDVVYYSARGNGTMISLGNWLDCPDQTDGNWHHYEFYVKFSTGISRFWYDGELVLNHTYGKGKWLPNNMYYIWAPSMDAEEYGTFSRQVDDLEVWDGIPTPPNPPQNLHIQQTNP
jgi:hypothetical protein